MKIIQVKGSNGSGKSTIPLQLLERATDVVYDSNITVLLDLGWILVGSYTLSGSKTSNGCDALGDIASIKSAIIYAIEQYPDFDVLFEGMMISTIKSTFYDYLIGLSRSHGIIPLFVVMDTTAEKCVERITNRGTRKRYLNVDNVRKKCEGVLRHAKTYDAKHVKYLDVDNTPLECMADAFLELAGDQTSSRITYGELVRMSDVEVQDALCELGTSFDNMDSGQRRRLLGTRMIEPLAVDRGDVIVPSFHMPYASVGQDLVYYERVGYVTGTGNELELIIRAHCMDRGDVSLLTEWEHASLCKDCKGSGGTCPGYAPRFDTLKPSVNRLYVITVMMDFAWALKHGYVGTIFTINSYADLITMTYIRRLLDVVCAPAGYYALGAGGCPGRCKKPCAVLRCWKCRKPDKRCYSMESVGIDCDWLHSFLYGEWLPWTYRGFRKVPLYMARYAGVLTDDNIMDCLNDAVLNDKSYLPAVPDYPQYDVSEFVVPSGVHVGSVQYMYDIGDDNA